MTISMTGFGSAQFSNKESEIYCEIKTVNHRFLEISTKPNDMSNQLDVYVRDTVSKKLKRGSVDIRFRLKFPASNKFTLNSKSLKNLLETIKDIPGIDKSSISFSDIKDMPGVIKSEQTINTNQKHIKKVFIEALDQLVASRSSEGIKIEKVFLSKINKNIDRARLEQEVAILVLKHDVAEEVERISFHTTSLKKELSSKKTSGKKIDFILQELFRETSTLSVKLDSPSYKQIALDMKLSVEEMREQAQNIE
jgi:uncharacterized protein YicC (UPF0701 family)